MRKIGRNDLCPCGSGKKHKKCCMMKDKAKQHREAALHAHQGAAEKAITWLSRRYGDEIDAWMAEDWFAGVDAENANNLSQAQLEMMQINAMEMMLAEGRWVRESGEEVVFMDRVLGRGGPLMGAEQRQYLQALGLAPLRLWEMTGVEAGVGLTLTDSLDETSMRKVQERSASRQLKQWDVIGARPVQTPAGHWELSGSIYHIPRNHVAAVKQRIEHEVQIAPAGEERFAISRTIASEWLRLLLDTKPFMPQIMDAATGEPMMLITEHYQVHDWDALANRLSAVPDVEGGRKQGWTRFQMLDKDMKRSLAAINLGKQKNRIELFTKSRKGAEEQQAWFEDIAGDTVRHLTREIGDPLSLLAHHDGKKAAAAPEIPDNIQKQLLHDYKRKHYAGWPDEPLPALDGKTPRESVKTPEGRKAVVELLKDFENMETGDEHPFDFEFLWKELGLNR
ncbi:MAG: SEC-C metal-binding domain-containing protein [Mariprofundaceae bacterium]|nr:SEC-C metal-binding domain-containing protein [Mariprofundaceae bacterium]